MARKRDDGNEITEEILSKLEKDIQKEYKQAYKDVRKKLKDFTESFEAERKQKLQDIKSGEITYKEYRDWCQRKIFVSDRWKALKESLAEDLANSDKIARSMAVQHSPEVYSVNHSFAGYQVSRDAAINPSFTIYNRRAVETLIRDKPDLLPVASKKMDIPKDKRWNEKKINSVVTQSILQGKPIDDVADSLVKVVGMDMSAAVRNARTMITNAQNRGRQDAFDELKEKGIPIREKWVATLDNRTRHSHRLMHGVYKGKDGYYPNGLRYPGDELGDPEEVYNCRCTEIAEVGEFAIDTPMHSSKMGEMTFDEWIQEGTGKADWYEAYNSDDWEIPDNKWKFEDQEEPQEEDLKEEDQEIQEESEEEVSERFDEWNVSFRDSNGNTTDIHKLVEMVEDNGSIAETYQLDSMMKVLPQYEIDRISEADPDGFRKFDINELKKSLLEFTGANKDHLFDAEITDENAKKVVERCVNSGIKANPIRMLSQELTTDQIIKSLGGGDMTTGSCVSQALCYAANRGGLDCNDFRGGTCCSMFSRDMTIKILCETDGIVSTWTAGSKPQKDAMDFLKTMVEGKEYILGSGRHTAVVRLENGQAQYLELQSSKENGFKPFTDRTLKYRFGTPRTSKYGSFTYFIEIDSLTDNDQFKKVMEYVNTPRWEEKKGAQGYEK